MEGVEIGAEGALDPRAQHLDRHLLAGRARRGRGGPGRSRRRRRLGELGKHLVDRDLQLFLDRARARSRSGTAAACPADTCSCIGKLVADHVGPGRQDLAELDVGRAQRGQRAGDGRQRRVALQPERREGPAQAPARRCAAAAARRTRPARRPARRCARRSRRCGSAARCCAGPRIRASSPNAAPRCPSTGCGISRCSKPAARIMPAKVS